MWSDEGGEKGTKEFDSFWAIVSSDLNCKFNVLLCIRRDNSRHKLHPQNFVLWIFPFPFRKFVGFFCYIIYYLYTFSATTTKRIKLTHILNIIRFIFILFLSLSIFMTIQWKCTKKIYKIYKKSIHHQTEKKEMKIYSLICEMKIEQSNTSLDVSAMALFVNDVFKWKWPDIPIYLENINNIIYMLIPAGKIKQTNNRIQSTNLWKIDAFELNFPNDSRLLQGEFKKNRKIYFLFSTSTFYFDDIFLVLFGIMMCICVCFKEEWERV